MNSNFIKVCTMIIGLLMCLSCASHRAGVTYRANDNCQVEVPVYHPTPAEIEKDKIFSLVAYAVVFKGWQQSRNVGRGYNIGSVLVDENDNIVCWARNAVNVTKNNTQHGEVRLMLNYLHNCRNVFSLPKYRLYTTLEPCAMCSGMMMNDNLTERTEFLLYQNDDDRIRIETQMQDETVWLTQKQMAELFQKDIRTINE
ncbi:MAG: hypothetical protein JRJ51_15510, partial [Deltaproteobacteria bacterium]|nr:hypothetical protein [Deltaproteobacteria bacterium]